MYFAINGGARPLESKDPSTGAGTYGASRTGTDADRAGDDTGGAGTGVGEDGVSVRCGWTGLNRRSVGLAHFDKTQTEAFIFGLGGVQTVKERFGLPR